LDSAVANAKKTGDCRDLMALMPAWPIEIRRGEIVGNSVYRSRDSLLEWRVAIHLARNGDREFLASMLAYIRDAVPDIVRKDLFNVLVNPNTKAHEGARPKGGVVLETRAARIAAGMNPFAVGDLKTDAQRLTAIKDVAERHKVSERTVRNRVRQLHGKNVR